MIEAVNSVISNAAMMRAAAEQLSTAQSFAATQQAVESVARAPQAPFISPYISMNFDYDRAVLQLRDSETGDVVNQFPSEQTLAARQRQQSAALNAQLAASTGGSPANDSGETAIKLPSIGASVPQGVTVVQESTPKQPSASLGAGVAQAAIAALSVGASVGQPTSTVSVTA